MLNNKIRKPKGYWDNYDNCKEECRKYSNLKELKANSSGCYYSLIRNKWKDKFFPNRIKIASKWENKDNCINKAMKYTNFATFIRQAYDCYLSMKEHGWLDDVFSDIPDYEEMLYWDNYDICKTECKKYDTISGLRRDNPKCYNSIIRNKWKDDFFETNHKVSKGYGFWNDKSHCIEEAKKYRSMTELKKRSNGCYTSVLRHKWENDCFNNFVKRKPNGYWNVKENCIMEAKKYRNLKEFQTKCYGAYHCAVINGWKNEINGMYDKTILYHSYNEKIHLVYIYLFVEYNTFYVGRTNNLKRRDRQHTKDHNDTLYRYCALKNIKLPPYVILKENLKATESQYYEDYYLNLYKEKGWIPLNIASTGVNKGSLGAICKWNYDNCKQEARKYESITDFKLNNQSAYNVSRKNGWIREFFTTSKETNGYWNNYDNCRRAFEDCKNARELIKRYGGCYNAIKKNHFGDLRYNRKSNEKGNELLE